MARARGSLSNMNKAFILPLALAAAPLALQSPALAQAGPKKSATAMATVTVSRSISVVPGNPLAFGLLKGDSIAGSVVVRPEGRRAAYGGAVMVGSGPCHIEFCEDDTSFSNPGSASYWGPGMLDVTGNPNAAFRISSPSTVAAYLRTPASGRMPQLYVRDFTYLCDSTGQASGVIGANGRDHCQVGGTIDIPAGMKTGSYRVNVPITVDYF